MSEICALEKLQDFDISRKVAAFLLRFANEINIPIQHILFNFHEICAESCIYCTFNAYKRYRFFATLWLKRKRVIRIVDCQLSICQMHKCLDNYNHYWSYIACYLDAISIDDATSNIKKTAFKWNLHSGRKSNTISEKMPSVATMLG